jgi:putative phosphoribosyl transferase
MECQRLQVSAAGTMLTGELLLSPGVRGIVVLPHGRGTGRGFLDGFVTAKIRKAGLATLLLDLLTAEEANVDARSAAFRFDIDRLAGRLAGATDWLARQPATRGLQLGYFGDGYGASAALVAAADRPTLIRAVVSHDGLPEVAERTLPFLTAATLLIGGWKRLEHHDAGPRRLIPGAEHAPDEVARLASEWFSEHLLERATCPVVQAA